MTNNPDQSPKPAEASTELQAADTPPPDRLKRMARLMVRNALVGCAR